MKAPAFSSIFMLLFLPLGLLLAVITLPGTLGGVESITWTSFMKGKWTVPFEKKFTEDLPIYASARAFWGTAEYKLFNDGRSGVVIGQDGWLFTAEEFQTSRKAPEIYADHVAYIESTAKALSDQGVRLVVALIPAKASIYQDKLGAHLYPASKQTIYADTYQTLSGKQIDVVDLAKTFSGHSDVFLKTDTHWSQTGAKLAAQEIAAHVLKVCPDCVPAPVKYQTVASGEVKAHDGDLLRYVPLTPALKTKLMQDKIGVLETQTTAEAATDGNSLFDDVSLPVVLVGTSYSANTLFNFAGYIEENLGTDILNAADEGKGPFVTMKAWRENALAEGQALPKLVIWEIPERYLTIADKTPEKAAE